MHGISSEVLRDTSDTELRAQQRLAYFEVEIDRNTRRILE